MQFFAWAITSSKLQFIGPSFLKHLPEESQRELVTVAI
jgi:hypothetical protein